MTATALIESRLQRLAQLRTEAELLGSGPCPGPLLGQLRTIAEDLDLAVGWLQLRDVDHRPVIVSGVDAMIQLVGDRLNAIARMLGLPAARVSSTPT